MSFGPFRPIQPPVTTLPIPQEGQTIMWGTEWGIRVDDDMVVVCSETTAKQVAEEDGAVLIRRLVMAHPWEEVDE